MDDVLRSFQRAASQRRLQLLITNGRIVMRRCLKLGALASVAMTLAGAALAQAQYGTADEAKAMLTRAVAAVKADKAKALDMFNKGEGGFLDRDLYPFCGNTSDGKILAVANPNAKQNIGKDVRELKDSTGKVYGIDIFAAGQKAEGQTSEVSYEFARPGDPKPVPKVSYVTRVGDLYCGVGYYKQ
jgi:signal transduction histidine kinase